MLAAWVDGALDAPSARDVACHVATCPSCHAAAAQLRRETDALRQALGHEKSPVHLWMQISARLAAEPAHPTLIAALRARLRHANGAVMAGALAASLLAGVLIVQLAPERGITPEVTLHTLAIETAQDYATFRISQRALDVSSDDPTETLLWLGTRINGALPAMAENVLGYQLVGGRLCWLMGQRLGALTYARGADQITVYIMPFAPGEDSARIRRAAEEKAQHAEGPVRSIVRVEGGLMVAIVSALSHAENERFAAALGQSLRPHHPEI
jgi:anti-sigma factor RsiW